MCEIKWERKIACVDDQEFHFAQQQLETNIMVIECNIQFNKSTRLVDKYRKLNLFPSYNFRLYTFQPFIRLNRLRR